MTMKLILHADDAGRSMAVNDRILELMGKELLSSASIVATGSAMENFAQRIVAFPRCSLGVHLFLDEFMPVTDLSAFSFAIKEDGCFREKARAYVYSPTFKRAIKTEWISQIERVRSQGIQVSHLDSHHHIHTFHPLFFVLKEVQRETGVRKVRLSMNCYAPPASRVLLLKKAMFNWALRHYVPTCTTSNFTDFRTFHALLSMGRLKEMQCLEIMMHPAAGTYMKAPEPYEAEIRLLQDGWQQRMPMDWELCSYNDLA